MAETGATPPNEQEAAAAWEAALSAEAAGGGAKTEEGERALSQSEIDSLLGFNNNDGQGNKTGIQALLDRAMLSYERLPMLEVVFDRYVRTLSTTLRNYTSENVDVSIDSIASMRFEDYLNTIPLPTLITVFQAIEWENFGIINIDSSLTYTMVDVLLGGGRTSRPVRIEGRPYTTIEQDIVKALVNLMLDDLSAAFNPLTPATFRFDRAESNPRFAAITRPANAVILIVLRLDMEERGGKAQIMFPYATLEPIKQHLVQMFTGEKFGKDNTWEHHLTSEVRNTPVNLEAVLKTKKTSLGDIARLKVGSTMVLDCTPDDDVVIKCEGVNMLNGKIGSLSDKVAICITDFLIKMGDEYDLA